MKNILITGGPVHCYLDAVKIITNRFKGGLIAELTDNLLSYDAKVNYVCAPYLGTKLPTSCRNLTIHKHKGFYDYERIVLELAPAMDAIILGAAVANLIPVESFKGKFPSHNYKPGDVIPINFTIAPRVIDKIKKVAPRTHLFGFKLLSGVAHDELIRAAYEIVLEAGATAVFANDTVDLKQKYAVTKERAVHSIEQHQLAEWIWQIINDSYYRTILIEDRAVPYDAQLKIKKLIDRFSSRFITVENGMIFGTVAVRHKSGFVTTGRGKRELDDIVNVLGVDHEKRKVTVAGSAKASLNAPLLARMFENPKVDYIIHYHNEEADLPTLSYAPPGTARDTERSNNTSFNIKSHGCILLFNRKDRRL